MKSCHYDIVRKENDKLALWLEAASNLKNAESRIDELASFWPGEFLIMNQQNHQVVEKSSDRSRGVISWTKRSLAGYKQD
jgi:hypothetical protein